MILGYDVSKHQSTIDHAAFKAAGYRFCYAKCSEGVGYRDPLYRDNAAALARAGVPFGSYHFARISLQGVEPGDVAKLKKANPVEFIERLLADARAEATWFLAVAEDGQLPHCLDVEWDKRVAAGITAPDVVRWCRCWLDLVRMAGRRVPVVYTGRNFWRYKLAKSLALADSHLWQADYGKRLSPIAGWHAALWQRTGSALRVDKPGKVDENVWLGDEAAFLDFADGVDGTPSLTRTEAQDIARDVVQPAWARAIMRVMQRFAESGRLDNTDG